MKRIVVILLIGALITAGFLTLRGSGSSPYRVAVIFDSAEGMTTGQRVKVAGVPVGTISEINLVPGLKARMVLDIQRKFAPFHSDASCKILPEGLISENFVQCNPGQPHEPLLGDGEGGLPTVPVQHTQDPVSLQQVLNVFSLPVDTRIQVFIGELGIGTAGEGQNLNAIIQRANPALDQSQRVLGIIDNERQELSEAIGQTNQVLAHLASNDRSVTEFVGRAAAVTKTTASHRSQLAETLRGLPPMLAAVRPGLQSLNRAMQSGTPLLTSLHASAPELVTLTSTLPAFTSAGIPALRTLGSAAYRGQSAVRSLGPIVKHVLTASVHAKPFAQSLDDFMVSFRDRGGSENLMDVLYSLATATSAYDSVSHIITTFDQPFPQCLADSALAGCSHAYTAPDEGTVPVNDSAPTGPTPIVASRDHVTAAKQNAAAPASASASHGGALGGAAAPSHTATAPVPTVTVPAIQVPSSGGSTSQGFSQLLNYLLGK